MSFEKTAPEKSEAAGGLFGRIGLFYVGSVQKVVYAHMVKIRQRAENLRGNVPPAVFVVGVAGLGAVEKLCQRFLLQVMIFPQIPDSPVHLLTPFVAFPQYIQNNLLY